MNEWNSTELPDFTVYGFHTGKLVDFRLHGGSQFTGVYTGYGIFTHEGVDYEHIEAWRPHSERGEHGR